VLRSDRYFWCGDGWSREIKKARRFAGRLRSFDEARGLAYRLRNDGFIANVAYVPVA
jgi:hypothetical protein